jgi:hypothetical protein
VCKECKKQHNANYYKANADRIRQHVIAYRKINADRIKQCVATYHKTNADRIKQWLSSYNKEIRLETLEAYGGAVCAHCGKTKLSNLTLDHINQDGAERQRKGEAKNGRTLWLSLKKRGFPSGFRVLCFNCNWKAWIRHKRRNQSKSARAYQRRKRGAEQKQAAFNAYGGVVCALCGEIDVDVLCLDHINNDGAEQRREGQGSGLKLYTNLKKLGYPSGFRVLCFNCNSSKENK